jgi:hypothetical protein
MQLIHHMHHCVVTSHTYITLRCSLHDMFTVHFFAAYYLLPMLPGEQ